MTFTADSVSAGVSSFSVAPSTATVAASASASGRPVVTIELTDQFGNPVSDLASSVTLALGGAVASTSLGVVETSTVGYVYDGDQQCVSWFGDVRGVRGWRADRSSMIR